MSMSPRRSTTSARAGSSTACSMRWPKWRGPRPDTMRRGELDFIEQLRAIATHPAARGLADDAALLGDLVLTHDTIAEGVHFLPGDPPASVGWKLVTVNLSDLAAKGAAPLAALMSATIAGDGSWEAGFLAGV